MSRMRYSTTEAGCRELPGPIARPKLIKGSPPVTPDWWLIIAEGVVGSVAVGCLDRALVLFMKAGGGDLTPGF